MSTYIKEKPQDSATLKVQLDYAKKVAAYNAERAQPPKYHIATFGCQMNAHDSERLSGMLGEMGYIKTEEEKDADLVVYNTCCVRENAENRVYGKLGYLKHIKERNPDFRIVLCGCMMQQNVVIEKIRKSYRFVDIIFGTYNLYRFPELLCSSLETKQPIIDIWQEHKEIVEDLPSQREFPHKAGVNIMYGCDKYCTFCIVPYVRGRERSRRPEDIVREITALAEDGVKEVMLLGQNVNSYGKGLEEKIDFAGLLELVNEIEGIERIRFMTPHPRDFSPNVIAAVRDLPKVCKHIHLPVQSGSTELLRRMNRRYTREQYLNLVHQIREAMPDVALTTDIIVGFPGETEEDFEDTLNLVREVRYNGAYTFLYSKRTGTPAARFENQVPEDVAGERFQRLLDVHKEIVYEINKKYEGKVVEVLAEDKENSREGYIGGRADDNTLVHFPGGAEMLGKMVKVRIIEAKPFYLMGEPMQ